jgi:hypothetical protein
MIGAGDDGLSACRLDGVRDLLRIGRDDHLAGVGLDRPASDMHDHRLAGDVGEGLARQPRCADSRRNDDQRSCHPHVLFILPAHRYKAAGLLPAGLRQFACVEGFFCSITCRIGKEENPSDPVKAS